MFRKLKKMIFHDNLRLIHGNLRSKKTVKVKVLDVSSFKGFQVSRVLEVKVKVKVINDYFAICASKTLKKASAIQKFSVTLSPINIVKIFGSIVLAVTMPQKKLHCFHIFNILHFIKTHVKASKRAEPFTCYPTLSYAKYNKMVLYRRNNCRQLV